MTPLRAVLLTLIVVGLAWVGAGLFGDSAYPASEEAMRKLALGESRAALAQYRALQQERPDLRQFDVNAALAALRTGDSPRALLDLSAATRAEDPVVRSTAYYDRGNVLFSMRRLADARASWIDSLRVDPAQRDAKFNLEVVDALIDLLGDRDGPGNGGQQPGQGQGQGQSQGQGQGQGQGSGPGSSPGPRGPSGAGGPQQGGGQGGTQGQGGDRNPGASARPSVGQAIIQFRRDKSIEEALLVLEALEAEQRGLEGLLEGTVPRRTGPGAGGGAPLY